MMLKLLSVLLYCLRWLAWAFHYLIIWPAATLMLLVAMLFWLDNSTPGQVAADEIAASTRYVSHGEFRIPGHCGPNLGGPLYGERCRSTDAAGYAAFVKNSVDELWRGNLKVLWAVMAVVFSGAALLMKHYPQRSRYVFVSVGDDRGYVRYTTARPERGMGQYFVHPVHKKTEQHRGFDVYASSLTLSDAVQGDECTGSGDDKN